MQSCADRGCGGIGRGSVTAPVYLFCFVTTPDSPMYYRMVMGCCLQTAFGRKPGGAKSGVIIAPDGFDLCGAGGGAYYLYLMGM